MVYTMFHQKVLEVRSDDHNSQKWSVALCEDVFSYFLAQGGEIVQRVFGEGSLFSPFLFEKFFDPADAFPLWEFEAELLLSGHPSTTKSNINWSESDMVFVFRAELPVGARNVEVAICGNKGKVVEISGRWKGRESMGRDWRNIRWWEHGFVRCLEVPDNADLRNMEASIYNDFILEIRIPKNMPICSTSQLNDLEPKESEGT